MRLLYVCTDPEVPIQGSKGASVHARGLITALHAAGHELTVASPRLEPGPNPLPAGVTVVELPVVKLYEYMAAGLCPLVSDVGELAATVGHGAAGVVIAPDDPAALADALVAIDRDRDRVRRLGAAAQAAARRLPGWSHHAARALTALAPRTPAVEVIR